MERINYENEPNEKYAGFWIRFVAHLIDIVLVQIAQAFVVIPVLGILGIEFIGLENLDFDSMPDEEAFVSMAAFISVVGGLTLLTTAIQVLYFSLMTSSKSQATIGKMAVGLKVTDMNGSRINFSRSILRELGKILSSFIFMIGYIMAAFTSKKQALHDVIANTLVIRAK